MNASTPTFYTNGAQYYPDATGDVGKLVKALDAQTLVVFDYSALLQVAGSTLTSISSFNLDIQTNPQLIISNAKIPDTARKTISFVVSAGVGGLTYDLTVNVVTSVSAYSHVLHVVVVQPADSDCCSPGAMAVTVPAGQQQATLPTGGVYGNTMPRYFVSPTAPTGPLVFDRWYNSTTGVISDYVTDGTEGWWQALYSLDVNLTRVSLYYFAGTAQLTFNTTTPDIFSNSIPLASTYALDVLVNGVRSLPMTPDGVSGDYTVNIPNSSITFKQALIPNDVVILDIVEIK